MKIVDFIRYKIARLPKGYLFTYRDFVDKVNTREGVIKALNRMADTTQIIKLAKGKYYKPETTPFGALAPEQSQIVKDLLEYNGKITGYLTGLSIYSQLGLTTQISNTIQIGKRTVRPKMKRERYTITFIKQNNTITKDNIPLLQILDAIRFIKKIPDTTIENSCKRIFYIIQKFSKTDKEFIAKLAMKYPPLTRALLGAILEELKAKAIAERLRQTLNPITSYKITNAAKVFVYASKWNIK